MRRLRIFLLILLLTALALPRFSALASRGDNPASSDNPALGDNPFSGETPASTARTIQEALFDAQMALAEDPGAAAERLETARAAYSGAFAQTIQAASPEVDARIRSGFDQASAAVERAVAVKRAAAVERAAAVKRAGAEENIALQAGWFIAAFAAARAQVETAIFAGGYRVVESALGGGTQAVKQPEAMNQPVAKNQPRSVSADGPALALAWLPVREFRPTTRFSRPNTGATLAVSGFAKGSISREDALLAVRADLLDTYQARLTESLHDLAAADERGFAARRAELAAQAQGYFWILSPAYQQQRGAEALQQAAAAFADLRAAALAGDKLDAALGEVDSALRQFRAAPLTPGEQARRAGQLLRFLSLIPVEYGRGVRDGQVLHDLELQEASTFHVGALAAFSDLETLLEASGAEQTAQIKTGLAVLGRQLEQARQKTAVVPVEEIQGQVNGLTGQLKALMPPVWLEQSSQGDFDVIASMLDQMEASVASSDYGAAESARLEAYAVMETGPEARLMVFAPQLKLTLEELFWNGQGQEKGLAYLIKNRAPAKEIQATRAKLNESLQEAQITLGANTSPASAAINTAMIVFREGLEAVIILASLMGSMKRVEERRYRKPMWLGAAAAGAATALTWVAAHDVLQSLARYGEKLEAVVSLIAIGVLLVIMNWFFHKMYWTEWIASFHARKRRLLSGEAGLWLGLIILGFTSVYREGFETVLFLQALVLESGAAVVLAGVGAALAAVGLVGVLTFRLQKNLPYKRLLVVTGVLIGAVLLQMVGNTTHILQVVGWLPIHVVQALPLPYWLGTWFGIYPTWEGIALQATAGIFVIGSYYLAEWMTHANREQKRKALKEASSPRPSPGR